MTKIKLGVLVGSLRKESYSQKVAQSLAALFPPDIEAEFLPIGQLTLFDQDCDDEGRTPESWTAFRRAVAGLDALLFVTPEYNRSVPGVLKNAIDIASRPPEENAWGKKPGMVVSLSQGRIGGFGANHHLRQVLSVLEVYLMPQPETYISNVQNVLEPGGGFKPERLAGFQAAAQAGAEWFRLFLRR